MSHIEAPLEFVEQYYIDDLAERNTPESIWALAWLKEIRGKHVLSIGCGPNFYDDVQFFSEIPDEFVGTDLNENNITFLKNSTHPEVLKWKHFLSDHKVHVELHASDVKEEQKEFINRFDTIYAIGVLGMFNKEDTVRIFKLLNIYLKHGGILVDIDWTEPYLSEEKLKERESYEWYSTQGPSVKEIGTILKDSGFEITKHDIYSVPDPKSYSWGKIYGYVAQKK